MKTTRDRGPQTTAGLTVGALLLALVLGLLAGGCGTSEGDVNEGGSSVTSTMTELPPIDLLAPTEFETASFALG